MKEKFKIATFRFYEELNDFLPSEKRKVSFDYEIQFNQTVKDAIQAMGVPHTEVDLILVNDKSVDFNYKLQNGDRVAVYPVFEALDISNVTHLRPAPLRQPKFILDVHLGKLAKRLRLLGFDTLYDRLYEDKKIIEIAANEKRIILTRDIGILKNNKVTHGYYIRTTDPLLQIKEVLNYFDLFNYANPFTRCLECNGLLKSIDKNTIEKQLDAKTKKYYQEFLTCEQCGKIYWPGSHYQKMQRIVDDLLGHPEE